MAGLLAQCSGGFARGIRRSILWRQCDAQLQIQLTLATAKADATNWVLPICWSYNRVVPAASADQARSRANRKHKKGYGGIVAARRANAQDSRLIRHGVWVRRRRDGSSPQFGSVCSKSRARRQRSSYRHWL